MEIWWLKNTISKLKNLLNTFNSLFKMTEERVGDDKVEKQREKRLKNDEKGLRFMEQYGEV